MGRIGPRGTAWDCITLLFPPIPHANHISERYLHGIVIPEQWLGSATRDAACDAGSCLRAQPAMTRIAVTRSQGRRQQ
jgi:hypothetical protein